MKNFILILILFPFILEAQIQWRLPLTDDYILEEKNDTLLKAEYIVNANGSHSYSFSFIDSSGTIFNTVQDTNLSSSGLGTKPFRIISTSAGFLTGVRDYYDTTLFVTRLYHFSLSGNLIWSLQLDTLSIGFDYAQENDTLFILLADSVLKVMKFNLSGNYISTPYADTVAFNLYPSPYPRIKVKNSRIYVDRGALRCIDAQGQILWTFTTGVDVITFEINSANQCFVLSYETTGPIGLKTERVRASKINEDGIPSGWSYAPWPYYGYPNHDFGHSIALYQDSVYFGVARDYIFSCDTLQFMIDQPYLFTASQMTRFTLKNVNNNFYIAKTKYFGGSSIVQIDKYLNGALVYQYSDTALNTSFNSFIFPQTWGFYFGTNSYIGKFTQTSTNLVEVRNEPFMLYPNPVSDQLTIESNYRGPLLIYDLLGQLKGTYEKAEEDLIIDVSKYSQGMYLIKTKAGSALKFTVY